MKTDHKQTDATEETGYNAAFGAWLKEERELQGITQEDAAVAGQINRKTLIEIEKGYIPKRSTLLGIATALSIPKDIMLCAAGFTDRKWPTDADRRFLYIQLETVDTEDLALIRSLVASLRVWRNQHPQMGKKSKKKVSQYDPEIPGAEMTSSLEEAMQILQAVIDTLPKQQKDRANSAHRELERLLSLDTEVQQGEMHARSPLNRKRQKEED